MLKDTDKKLEPEKNPAVRLFKKIMPFSDKLHGDKFFIRENGKRTATLLFLVLIIIEMTDLVFAVDSIPAILAVTQDHFIVYTSNVFAILGLRSLYFALANIIDRFKYLSVGLSIILIFVGLKMVMVDIYKVEIHHSLIFIISVLITSVVFSVLRTGQKKAK